MRSVCGLNLVRILRFTQFALKTRPKVGGHVFTLVDKPFALKPLPETGVVDVLHAAVATTRRQQRVLFRVIFAQTDAAHQSVGQGLLLALDQRIRFAVMKKIIKILAYRCVIEIRGPLSEHLGQALR
jgi:hypothetical protein